MELQPLTLQKKAVSMEYSPENAAIFILVAAINKF